MPNQENEMLLRWAWSLQKIAVRLRVASSLRDAEYMGPEAIEVALRGLEIGQGKYILCKKCNGTGYLDLEDQGKKICPVCDGEPKITYEAVEEYAKQIDNLRFRMAGARKLIKRSLESL